MFQKRHLDALAAVLAGTRPPANDSRIAMYQWKLMVDRIARMVVESNPRASKQRFVDACRERK